MKKFEFLDWATADMAFKAYGKDLNELFENSALALFEIMTDTKKVKKKVKKIIKVKGEDLKSLMFVWLNELLFFVDAERLVFSKFKVKINTQDKSIEAEVWGEVIDREKHEIRSEVKAVTYHQMEIQKDGKIWEAQVLADL